MSSRQNGQQCVIPTKWYTTKRYIGQN